MAGRAARFVWRERCDAINWRMLRALDLADVVRRGDPARLEPLALHLTFARLPRTATATATGDLDAWAVVRVLQLAMEYLLFMRSRDGDVVDSLHQQLQLCERDLDEARTRADKWKGRMQSGERQVDKLHQVLQNIAKLLHIHGASPSAVATIETLLTELVVERHARQQGKRRQRSSNAADDTGVSRAAVDEAQVCGRCGKLFSSTLYLQKHVVRRHSSKTGPSRPAARSPTAAPISNSSDNNSDEQGTAQALSMQSLVHKFDQMLHSHEENFRLLSAQEANRVQHLYEQFHVEAQLVEELKASRLHGEQELGAQREALDAMLREKVDVNSKLDELKDEIQRLTTQHKQLVDAQASVSVPAPVAAPVVAMIPSENGASDGASNAQQQVIRLQTTLQEASQALEETRVKLSRLQAEHLSAIREKQMLSDRLDQARDTIDRLEESTAAASHPSNAPPARLKVVSVVTKEAGTQASPAVTADATVQTDCIAVATSTADQPQQPRPMVQETSTQTEPDLCRQSQVLLADASVQVSIDDLSKVDSGVGDDPVIQTCAQAADESTPTTRDAETPETDSTGVSEYIQEMSSRELLDTVMARSERATASTTRVKSSGTRFSQDTKPYSSIPQRSYLHSHFPHPEASVKDRIAHCLEKVNVFAGRFGVSARNGQVLSDEHFRLVRQALHAHLEVLPTDVLDRMVQCEAAVNKLIESEWVPREKTREQALERFKLETHAKSALNQALVKQALAAFRSGSPHKAGDKNRQSTREISQEEADAEANANRSKDAAGAVSNGGDSERLGLPDLRQDVTLGGSASGGDKGVPSDTLDKRDQELGDRQRDDHQHGKKYEATDDTTQRLSSETKHVHPEPDEVPAPISMNCLATGPCQTFVDPPSDVADSPCEDGQTALMSNIMEQVEHTPEGTISSVSREAMDGVDTSLFEDPHAVQLRDDQELVDALADARPRASSPQTLAELCQLDPSEYADARADEIEIAENPINDTSLLSAPATPVLARSLEELAHSERSMSVAASSELSFAASVPSLESEDSRGDVGEAATRDSTILNEALPLDPSDSESSETNAPTMDEWETIESHEADDRPALQRPDSCTSDPSDSSPRGVTAREESLCTDLVSRTPLRPAPADDDDDIEEIELA